MVVVGSRLSIDIETFATADLKLVGAHKYAQDPSTEVLVICYAFDDEPVETYVPSRDGPVPDRMRKHIESGGVVSAFNYEFERTVLNGMAGRKIDFPQLTIEQGRCSMAKARSHGLPGGLGDVAAALGTHPKSSSGRGVMMQLSKPRKGAKSRYTPQNSPEKFEELYRYCKDDVEAERGVDRAIPDLSPAELEVWRLDQKINERGVLVDLPSVANAQYLIDVYKTQLHAKCFETTGCSPSQTGKLAEWVRNNGYSKLENLQVDTVNSAVADEKCPQSIKTVLKTYSTYGAKAVSKFDTLEDMACADGRIRGLFKYWGANTGRWSSTGVQLQNLARGYIDDPECAIETFKARDLDWLRSIYPTVDPMKVLASTVRGMLIPSKGKDLLALDFSAIEARVCAWLFGEKWKIEAFRNYDEGKGPDLYKLSYARSFGIDVSKVSKAQRQVGKCQELALQYEGGVGAFVTMAKNYGLDLDELGTSVLPIIPEEVRDSAEWTWTSLPQLRNDLPHDTFIACDALKRMWRSVHPAIVMGWKNIKEAAEMAVQYPGKVYSLPGKKVMFKVEGSWLYMRLPSGRRLAYYKPRWVPEHEEQKMVNGKLLLVTIPGELRYFGVDTYTRQWKEITTYGGRLAENLTQAVARDLLVNGMMKLDKAGYPIVMTVHDEAVAEVDKEFGSVEEASKIFCDPAKWAEGCPVVAEGWRGSRYRK